MGCYSGTPDLSFFKFWNIVWVSVAAIVTLIAIALTLVLIRKRRRKVNAPQ
jgi:heme/copper-type cytochrome/quinol oxidase subunit 2